MVHDGYLIHDAALAGANRVLAWLIDKQICDVDARAADQSAPLHYAAYSGHLLSVATLLERHAFIDAATVNGETPLHRAVGRGDAQIARQLINAGANLGATDKGGTTPLALAAMVKSRVVSRLLLEHQAPWTRALPDLLAMSGVGILREPPLSEARLNRCPQDGIGRLFSRITAEDARLLLDRGADPGVAAGYALMHKTLNLLPLIRDYGRFRYIEAHHKAAAFSLLGMRELLKTGGNPNTWIARKDGTRLPLIFYVATEMNAVADTIPLLLEHGADPEPPAESDLAPLLCELCKHSHCTIALMHELIELGQDVNRADRLGRRPLHELVTSPWREAGEDLLRAFLAQGANANVADNWGCTPLMLAIKALAMSSGLSQRVSELLSAGANANARDQSGWTALHHYFASPADNDDRTILDLLLKGGANIFEKDKSGAYPDEVGENGCNSDQRASVRRLRSRALWHGQRRLLASVPNAGIARV
jgi:ankyrin repeat protein